MIGSEWVDRPGPMSDRFAAELVDAILCGRFLPGMKLPAQRELAKMAGTSRATVAAALEDLAVQGWVETRSNARSIARLPDADRQFLSPTQTTSNPSPERARIAAPAAELSRATDRARSKLPEYLSGDGRVQHGLPALRELISARYTHAGLQTVPEQIIVTNGAMGAFAMAMDVTRGRVLVEDPTYHGALEALRRRRRRTVGWRRGTDWDFDELGFVVRSHQPALAYVIADFHNPTGSDLDGTQRQQLATIADSTMLVVDETLRALRLEFDQSPPAHVATFNPQVVTIGGLSKTVWSGLRIGWLRLPDAGHDLLSNIADTESVPILDQLVAVELWEDLDKIIVSRCKILRQQRDELLESLAQIGLAATSPAGGLVCWVDLGSPVAVAVSESLNAAGYSSAPGTRFSPSGSFRNQIRIPFTADADEIQQLVGELGRLIQTRRSGQGGA